ncbi:MAG: GvpL/GvpF family gas vesicle protein [Chloroflexota bacterium]|nr:GvpL/GvpF family gas vesicle protein [Chloroflexota bacterium]
MEEVIMRQDDFPLAEAPETERACYVYAVARPRDGCKPGPLPAEGIVPQSAVYTVTHRDLLAVVSPVSLVEFGPEALEISLQDIAWAQARVLAHQGILAGLLDDYALIPFKFCTVYISRQRVQAMLAQHYQALDDTLRRLAGATEWGVKNFCSRRLLVEWIQEHSEALRPQREAIALTSAGAGYFLRKKLEKAAQREAERVVDACVQVSHTDLGNHARQAVTNPVQSPAVHGRKAEMVLNGAYLVDDSNLGAFQTALATLEATYAAQGFAYELTGPWPPYNFAALHLQLEEAVHEPTPG